MTDILNETEVAELLACEPSTVQTMARNGDLPAVKFGKHWRFPRVALLVLAGGFASGGHFKASRAASYWLMQAFRASLTWSAR